MQLQDVLYTKNQGIATITLNRPEVLNAFSKEMLEGWVACIEDAKLDQTVKVVVVTGAGRGFCSGMDAKLAGKRFSEVSADKREASLIQSDDEENSLFIEQRHELKNTVHRIPRALATLDKPYVGIINGPCAGAGMDMASMCDIRIASDNAKFTMAYVKMGLVPGDGGCYFLPKILGISKALDLIWTGRIFGSTEALEMGYVDMVFPQDQLVDQATDYLLQIASGPSVAIQVAKRLVYQCWEADLNTALDLCQYGQFIARATEDSKEGPIAFVQKRKPEFKGR